MRINVTWNNAKGPAGALIELEAMPSVGHQIILYGHGTTPPGQNHLLLKVTAVRWAARSLTDRLAPSGASEEHQIDAEIV
jgi:hypothetical protein